jgi:hypothetical protein
MKTGVLHEVEADRDAQKDGNQAIVLGTILDVRKTKYL